MTPLDVTRIYIRDHAYARADERFGWKGGMATAAIERLYTESRYLGIGQGKTHVLEHIGTNGLPDAQLVVEYGHGWVRIVTLMPPTYYVSLKVRNPDPPEADDAWLDWVRRNGKSKPI